MKLSIIIPCHNEETVLRRKIENTLALGKDVKEIIVVDDHSTDGTHKLAKKIGMSIQKVKIIQNKGRNGKNTAVREALNVASEKIIGVTDCDVLLPSNTVEAINKYFKKGEVGAVCLATELVFKAGNANRKYAFLYERIIRLIKIFESRIDSVTVPHAQAIFFKKEIGVYAERQADDVDLAIRIRKKGYKVKYAGGCFFKEEVLEDKNTLREQKVRRCKAVIDSLLHHKDVLFNPKYGVFGFMCYPIDLVVFVLSPMLFFIFIIALNTSLFFINTSFAIFFAIMMVVIFTCTRCKNIIHLSMVNIHALKGYMKQGNEATWETAREKEKK
jgi:cellulose synthase/poly-beta-1,6-N-acetylglucosamine synthase-like glycosyltransferase